MPRIGVGERSRQAGQDSEGEATGGVKSRTLVAFTRSRYHPGGFPSNVSFDGTDVQNLGPYWSLFIPNGTAPLWMGVAQITYNANTLSYDISREAITPLNTKHAQNKSLTLFGYFESEPSAPTYSYDAFDDSYSPALSGHSRTVPSSGTGDLYMFTSSYDASARSTAAWSVTNLTGTDTFQVVQYAESADGPWSSTVPTINPYWVRNRGDNGEWHTPRQVSTGDDPDPLGWTLIGGLSWNGVNVYYNSTFANSSDLDNFVDIRARVRVFQSWSNTSSYKNAGEIIFAPDLIPVVNHGSYSFTSNTAIALCLRNGFGLGLQRATAARGDSYAENAIARVMFMRASGTTSGRVVASARFGGMGHNYPVNVSFWGR